MVAGGQGAGTIDKVEIIDLIDSLKENVVYVDKSMERIKAFGGLLQNLPLVGGGCSSQDLTRVFRDFKILGQPDASFQTLDTCYASSFVIIDQTKIYVTGGFRRKSTEILSLDQPPVKGPELSFMIDGHSMIQVDPKTIYLIGGMQHSDACPETWIIDPMNNFDIKSGLTLNEARMWHSCKKMKINQKIYLVVVGGWGNHGILDSVELLDTTSANQGWIKGMNSFYILNLHIVNISYYLP